MVDCNICVLSLNVNGMGDSSKRTAVLSKLNKKHKGLYLLQETHSTEQSESTWRNNWGNKNVFFSHGTSSSRGVAILISNGIEVNVTRNIRDEEGRYIILEIRLEKSTFTIANLYAPTKNYEKEQIKVLKEFNESLQECNLENVIIGGDFNLCLDPKLDKLCNTASSSDNPSFRKEVISFLETQNLVDMWRVLNPNTQFFTWHRGSQKSRLDYLFTSEHLLNIVDKAEILPGLHSDHSLIKISLNSKDEHKTGRGFWKFNSSLLYDDTYVQNIKMIISSSGEKYCHMQDKRLVWELIKFDIRNFTIPYSIQKKKDQNLITQTLEKRFNELHNLVLTDRANEVENDEFNSTKQELELIERHKARGIILRSKCRWVEDGEKNSSYFLRLEKNNYCNKHITQLQINENIVNCPKEILYAEKEFYENLYSESIDINSASFKRATELFTKSANIPRITNEEKLQCEEDLTESEILKSLKNMKNGKSPGTDGLVAEFYKFFWIDIKQFLLESLKLSLSMGELSIEQRRGIITLIPKKDKNRLFLKNWRPISLLNVDFKILTKALANRLCKVLPNIIHEDQTGYIKGRFIGCNIRLIEDVMFFTEMNNLPGIILNIDFEKAFDSINWNFVFKSLEAFNFGEKFISFIKTLYNNISSTIINNGEISDWFSPKRGVRQGCPISPYLFIIAVELLAINIRENKDVKGINIDGTELKISQLADDTNCFVSDTESVQAILSTFGDFKLCAGLIVNMDKTNGKFIGSLKHVTEGPFDLDWSGKYVSSLGITISGNEIEHYDLNYKQRLLNLKNLLNSWKGRKLSLKGKVTVVNTLAISSLIYVASVIHTPDIVVKEVKELIVNFMWDGKGKKIAYDVLIQNIQDGGLKLVDFESKVKTLKVSWIKRLTNSNDKHWTAAPAFFYNTKNLNNYFLYNQSKIKMSPKFYQDIHNYWSELQCVNDSDPKKILNQVIWNNRYITINKQPFHWKKWMNNGIMYITDLLHSNGQFLSHIEISEKYNINCNFINAMQIRQSISMEWRTVVQTSKPPVIKTEERCYPSIFIKDKRCCLKNVIINSLYWIYVDKKKRQPSCIAKWQEDYTKFNEADHALWQNIFSLSFCISRETKLQSFQYRLIHRIIPSRKRLFDMKIVESPACVFCDNAVDNIVHFMLFCPKTQVFWQSFFEWWNRLSDVKIPLDYVDLEESIIFGFQLDDDPFLVLNYCALIAKYYIYRQKLFHDNNVDFYEYLCELKFKLQIELNICKKNNTVDNFNKFLFIHEYL